MWQGFARPPIASIPVEPEPRHLLTQLTFRGQKVYLESTGDDRRDEVLLRRWNQMMEQFIRDRYL